MEPADGGCRGLQSGTGPSRARPGLKAQAPPISVECRYDTPVKRKNTSDAPFSPRWPPSGPPRRGPNAWREMSL